MSKAGEIIPVDDAPPEVQIIYNRIRRASRGRTDFVAMATLRAYANVLLEGSVDFDQYMRNVVGVYECLKLNGEAHFKVKSEECKKDS